ncbi:MAG TPA: DUF2500 domain-containing protein, partial [Candidatus Limnocylindria bacterium]|nr:DUF2500 domain-containing protein [Candidatus Limnocylindria bacterium]
LLVFGLFAFKAIQGIAQWSSNNAQPVLTVPARVVTKRQHVSGGGHDSSASTWYYVTFETLADGLRQEFAVRSTDYSGLAEDDTGDLTYQGTRYNGFVRARRPAAPSPPPPAPPAPDWTCGYCASAVPNNQSKCPACGATHRVAPPITA